MNWPLNSTMLNIFVHESTEKHHWRRWQKKKKILTKKMYICGVFTHPKKKTSTWCYIHGYRLREKCSSLLIGLLLYIDRKGVVYGNVQRECVAIKIKKKCSARRDAINKLMYDQCYAQMQYTHSGFLMWESNFIYISLHWALLVVKCVNFPWAVSFWLN